MAVTLYKWDDASAPAILDSGTGLGTLLAVLDGCLVNGYGAKAAAGWTKPFANSGNIGVYKNSDIAGGTGTIFRIDDSALATSRLTAFETMSTISVGTNMFPTTAQVSGGLYIRKLLGTTIGDALNDGKWYIVANERAAHIFIQAGKVANSNNFFYVFIGDIISFATVDPYKSCVFADTSSLANFNPGLTQAGISTTVPGLYMRRDVTGLQLSVSAAQQGNLGICDGRLGYGNTNIHTFPNPIDGNLIITNIFVSHGSLVRGIFPGLKAPCHRQPFTNLMAHTGDGDLAGKTFLAMNAGQQANTGVQLLVETSDTWYV